MRQTGAFASSSFFLTIDRSLLRIEEAAGLTSSMKCLSSLFKAFLQRLLQLFRCDSPLLQTSFHWYRPLASWYWFLQSQAMCRLCNREEISNWFLENSNNGLALPSHNHNFIITKLRLFELSALRSCCFKCLVRKIRKRCKHQRESAYLQMTDLKHRYLVANHVEPFVRSNPCWGLLPSSSKRN